MLIWHHAGIVGAVHWVAVHAVIHAGILCVSVALAFVVLVLVVQAFVVRGCRLSCWRVRLCWCLSRIALALWCGVYRAGIHRRHGFVVQVWCLSYWYSSCVALDSLP